MRDEVERACLRRIFAKFDLEIVIAGHALILPQSETVDDPIVDGAHDIGDILALIIERARDRVRRLHGSDGGLHRRNGETLVHEDLRSCGMIDRHQREIIVVVDLP